MTIEDEYNQHLSELVLDFDKSTFGMELSSVMQSISRSMLNTDTFSETRIIVDDWSEFLLQMIACRTNHSVKYSSWKESFKSLEMSPSRAKLQSAYENTRRLIVATERLRLPRLSDLKGNQSLPVIEAVLSELNDISGCDDDVWFSANDVRNSLKKTERLVSEYAAWVYGSDDELCSNLLDPSRVKSVRYLVDSLKCHMKEKLMSHANHVSLLVFL